jgi:AcrR family transcriptional regulator
MDTPTSRGRPRVSSRAQIEEVAVELFLRQGYATTTMPAIAEAAGVSRTSVFRYFHGKSEIVWWAFDVHLDEFASLLDASDPASPVLDAVRSAIVRALESAADDHGAWLRRFELIDGEPELRAEEAAHWARWADAISASVQSRLGLSDALIPAAIGGALQAAYVARLRTWVSSPDVPIAPRIVELDAALLVVCDALSALVGDA